MKKSKSRIFYSVYLVLLILPCAELASRIAGVAPYIQVPYKILSKPAKCLLPDSLLGFSLRPGYYEVTINDHLTYRANHSADGFRVLSENNSLHAAKESRVVFLGCSYTYGMGVNDAETYPYLLSESISGKVENWAVPGFGTVQGLLQLKQAAKAGNMPELLVVSFAHFHSDRNVLAPGYLRDLKMGFLNSDTSFRSSMSESQFPYYELVNDQMILRRYHWAEIGRWEYLRTKSAAINFVFDLNERIETTNQSADEITFRIFQEMAAICKENGTMMIVVGITYHPATKAMLQRLDEYGILSMDASFDPANGQWDNLPYDAHPNKEAHARLAANMEPVIGELLESNLRHVDANWAPTTFAHSQTTELLK